MPIGVLVDNTGVSVRSFREIREELAERMHGIFGNNLDLSPSSPDGQLLDLFCYAYSDSSEAIQAAYSQLDPASAEGTFLDNIGTLMGIERNGRSDDDYRSLLLSSEQTGLATYNNMLTYLKSVLGDDIGLVENSDGEADQDGIPGHSLALFVNPDTEKTDDEIAAALWHSKPAGIGTWGSESGNATDSAGRTHVLRFSKVSATEPYFMRITISEYSEEILPSDYKEQISSSVSAWALKEYTPGKDIIPQRAIMAVYEVPGIDTVEIEVSSDGETWSSSRVSVPVSKYAILPKENISVVKE